MNRIIIFFGLMLTISACSKAEEAAKKMCECSDELLKSKTAAGDASDTDELFSASQQMRDNYNSYAKCASKLQQEYKGQVDNVEFENAMKEICPDNYKVLKEIEMAQKGK
jgi:cell division septum initiation protein DivIVA